MAPTYITVDSHVQDLLAISLGHRPDTVHGRLAVQNWLDAEARQLPTARRNIAMTAAVIEHLVKPEFVAEWARYRLQKKAFKPALPAVAVVLPLTERQQAKKLRNSIYAARRAEKAQLKREKAAEEQRQRDEIIGAQLDAEARREEEVKSGKGLGFA